MQHTVPHTRSMHCTRNSGITLFNIIPAADVKIAHKTHTQGTLKFSNIWKYWCYLVQFEIMFYYSHYIENDK